MYFENFEKKPIPDIDVDRLDWWRKEKEFARTFKVAQEVMSIACSSSMSERVFSQVSLNDTAKKRRLDPQSKTRESGKVWSSSLY